MKDDGEQFRQEHSASQPGSRWWLTITSLWWREIIRFYRQRSRVVGALGSPFVFWILIGSGFGNSFHSLSAQQTSGYLAYFFPGTVMMILLFTSIFSSISVIEERREGFLLSVLVAPIPRVYLVLGKVLGGATLAVLQGMILLLFAPLMGVSLSLTQWLLLAGVLSLNAFALTALGFVCAWQTESVQGFHAVMNMALVPMWVLSGALFPASGASDWVRWIMQVNPLTYGTSALRRALYVNEPMASLGSASFMVCLAVLLVFALLTIGVACLLAQRRTLRGMP